MNEQIISRAGEIIAGKNGGGNEGYCTLSLIDNDGYPTASTISVSKSDGINWITFCTGFYGNKPNRISKNNRASICFNSEDYNITLVGTIAVITDPVIKKEMWYEGLSNHYNGPEDSDYCVLRFHTEHYNLLIDWKEARGKL